MAVSSIDHLLCTHCTFGTSALEDASEEAATKVLGYSVRASSIPIRDRSRLRDEFRAVERLLSYELPVDATANDKSRLDATTAPTRLCFIPDIAGRQVAGSVVYRPFDTAKRPGSYFAHLLVGPATHPWSVTDVLRLWGLRDPSGRFGWAEVDRAEGFPHLDRVASLRAWPARDHVWLTDEVAHSFLQTGTASAGKTPSTVLPERWATDVTVSARTKLLELIVQAVIEQRTRPSVVIACEPVVAAVLFYSALSLLPKSLRAGIGFSTYESDLSRASTALVATTFMSPESDFRPEVHSAAALRINTFRSCEASMAPGELTAGRYAKWAVQKLLNGDLMRVKELCAAIDAVWGKPPPSVEEMDQVLSLEDFRRRFFNRQDVPMPRKLTTGLHRFLAMRCGNTARRNADVLCRLPPQAARGIATKLEAIVRPIPEEWNRLKQEKKIAAWLSQTQPLDEANVLKKLAQPASRVSDDELVSLILSSDCVTKEHRLPHGSPPGGRLWGEVPPPQGQADYVVPPVLIKVLAKLDAASTIRILPRPLPPLSVVIGIIQAVQSAAAGVGNSSRNRRFVRQLLDEAAGGEAEGFGFEPGIETKEFESLLEFGGEFASAYDPVQGRFGSRVSEFIRSFDKRVGDVCCDGRLINLAYRWKGCCIDHDDLGKRLDGWKRTLSWFAVHDDKGKIPFKGVTRTAFKSDVGSVLPGEGPIVEEKRRAFLCQLLDEFRNRKILGRKQVSELASLIDAQFPPSRR